MQLPALIEQSLLDVHAREPMQVVDAIKLADSGYPPRQAASNDKAIKLNAYCLPYDMMKPAFDLRRNTVAGFRPKLNIQIGVLCLAVAGTCRHDPFEFESQHVVDF